MIRRKTKTKVKYTNCFLDFCQLHNIFWSVWSKISISGIFYFCLLLQAIVPLLSNMLFSYSVVCQLHGHIVPSFLSVCVQEKDTSYFWPAKSYMLVTGGSFPFYVGNMKKTSFMLWKMLNVFYLHKSSINTFKINLQLGFLDYFILLSLLCII